MKHPREILIKLLELMLKVRAAEEAIVEVYGRDQAMRTPTHLSIGQEAVAAGLCQALREDDQIFTGHRCHAAFLAKGGEYDPFFAELCGRAAGISGGRAGSAHLTDVARGIFSSPILGAMLPVAVGAGLSFKMDETKRVAVALLGDAAIEEGIFAESLNFAVTKKLPVLFICENNLYSTHSPLSVRQPPSPIFERVRIPELKTLQIDGNDVIMVYETCAQLLEGIRGTSQPIFIECLTYRVREHVGSLFDYDRGYRAKEEVDAWTAKCPVEGFKKYLLGAKVMTAQEIQIEEIKWKTAAGRAYQKALQSPWPSELALLENVF